MDLKDLENHLQTIMEAEKNGGIIDIKEEAVQVLAMCNEIRANMITELSEAEPSDTGSNCNIQHVINSATAQMIHYDLAIKANELMKQHDTMKVEYFRELPEVKRLWNAMDVIKEHYL